MGTQGCSTSQPGGRDGHTDWRRKQVHPQRRRNTQRTRRTSTGEASPHRRLTGSRDRSRSRRRSQDRVGRGERPTDGHERGVRAHAQGHQRLVLPADDRLCQSPGGERGGACSQAVIGRKHRFSDHCGSIPPKRSTISDSSNDTLLTRSGDDESRGARQDAERESRGDHESAETDSRLW